MSVGQTLRAKPGRSVLPRLLLALAAGPAAWIAQLVLDFGVAGYACYGGAAPQMRASIRIGAGEPVLLLVLNLAGLAVAVAGAVVAYGIRRDAAGDDGGVGRERTRFLAACALYASVGFAGAILFDTAEPFMTPACWRFGP